MNAPARASSNASCLAFCSKCRGVLPFDAAGTRLVCSRCGTVHRQVDPGAAARRRSARYAIYAVICGVLLTLMALGMAALGADHPLVTGRGLFMAVCLSAVAVGCAARSASLRWDASGFEKLEPHELADLPRRLCPGMIRSDVVDELSRRGWRADCSDEPRASTRLIPATPSPSRCPEPGWRADRRKP